MTAIAVLTVYNCLYVEPETPRTRLDGDTFRCQGKIDPLVPDSRTWIPKVRLVRVNAPETGDQGAEEARSALIAWLSRKAFDLHCVARDKYGRLLADAEGDDGLLSDYMLSHHLVVPMSTEKVRDLIPGLDEAHASYLLMPHESRARNPFDSPS